MRKLILIIPILFMSCKTDVEYSINKMKAPAVITVQKKGTIVDKANIIVRDDNGKYYEIHDDIFENSKVGDTLKF